jgi:hypothetical protein
MVDKNIQNLITLILSEKFDIEDVSDYTDADWHKLFDFAERQNLHLLIYKILRTRKAPFPKDIFTRLNDVYHAACAQDFRRKEQLKEIIKILSNNRVEHILLKGAHLISSVYEKSTSRRMCDLDILVHEKDADKAYELLINNGYVSSIKEYKKLKKGFEQHFPPLIRENCLPVEMHTALSRAFPVNLKNIWQRSELFNIGNIEARVMCPEDLIMHIAFHKFFVDRSMNGLLGLYDIAQIINIGNINWNRLRELTQKDEWNNAKYLFIALYLLKNMFKSDIDDSFIDSIRPVTFSDKYEKVINQLMFAENFDFDKTGYNLYTLFQEIKREKSIKPFFKRVIKTPEKMALNAKNQLGNKDFTTKNLTYSYLKRIYNVVICQHGAALFKYFFAKAKNRETIEFAKNCDSLEEWLKAK